MKYVKALIAIVLGILLASYVACSAPPPPPPVPPPPPPVVVPPSPAPEAVWPPEPTRDEVLRSKLTFQGLTLQCDPYGTIPLFEAALVSFDADCRRWLYDQKRTAGDTAAILDVSWNYAEPGQPYGLGNLVQPRDLTHDLPAFRKLVEEAVENGFIPWVFLAGDGQSTADCSYNDPVGWTYGFDCTYARLPHILDVLDQPPSLRHRVLIVTGFDSVFYGWTPDQVAAFGTLFRAYWPDGYLAIEHDAGHIPVGNGPRDYEPGGAMATYDVILGEFPSWPTVNDQVYQILGRMVRPYYRPSTQPAGDDPTPPYYLAHGTPRGPYVYHCFEYGAYPWVRGRLSAADSARARQYYYARGCPVVD